MRRRAFGPGVVPVLPRAAIPFAVPSPDFQRRLRLLEILEQMQVETLFA